jgi:hypothetical protein
MYDCGRPLALHLNVPIIALLKITKQPPEQAIPRHQISDSALEVGPDVLAAQHRIAFSLLVDGQPNLEMESHLTDVAIKRQQTGPEQMVRRISYATLGAATAAVIGVFVYTAFAAASVAKSPTAPPTAPVSAQAINVRAVLPPFGRVEKIAYDIYCPPSASIQRRNIAVWPIFGNRKAAGTTTRRMLSVPMESR